MRTLYLERTTRYCPLEQLRRQRYADDVKGALIWVQSRIKAARELIVELSQDEERLGTHIEEQVEDTKIGYEAERTCEDLVVRDGDNSLFGRCAGGGEGRQEL